MKKVLFVCVHNSARSQMAEILLNKYAKGILIAESAGLEPTKLNDLVVKAMKKEESIDILNKESNSVFEFFKTGRNYNYVITLCDNDNAKKCPVFPGISHRIQWYFDDPSQFNGTEEEKIEKIIKLKNSLKSKILQFIELVTTDTINENMPFNWVPASQKN